MQPSLATPDRRPGATAAGRLLVLAVVLAALLALPAAPAAAVPADEDQDGLNDLFEEALARRFFPNLWVTTLQDRDAFYGCIDDDPWARVPFMVEPVWFVSNASGLACLYPGDCLMLKIGLAYDRDFGDTALGFPGIDDHNGDSEFYYGLLSRVNLQRSVTKTSDSGTACTASYAKTDPSCWWLMADWTSAHTGEVFDSSRFAVLSPLFSTIGDSDGAIVYAADGKHANYHRDEECDEGGVPLTPLDPADDCKPRFNIRDTCMLRFRNIGNTTTWGGDGQGDGFTRFIRYPESSFYQYDMWSGLDFGGSSAYLPKFTDRNGAALWEHWANCVYNWSITTCWRFDTTCQSDDARTCYDADSPNWAHILCGNQICSPGETCSSCPQDCGACPPVCGNGTCESGESCSSCKPDCGACPTGPACGNGLCESGESCETGGGPGQCQPDCGCCAGWDPVCFPAGTQIALADGTTRPIERLLPGDSVLAYDEARGRVVVSRVARTFTHPGIHPGIHPGVQPGTGRSLVRINGRLTATANHPFYVEGARQPVRADQLAPGDRLLVLAETGEGDERRVGRARRVESVVVRTLERLPAAGTVYNLEVAGEHNYFAGGVLVHNKTAIGGCEPGEGGPAF